MYDIAPVYWSKNLSSSLYLINPEKCQTACENFKCSGSKSSLVNEEWLVTASGLWTVELRHWLCSLYYELPANETAAVIMISKPEQRRLTRTPRARSHICSFLGHRVLGLTWRWRLGAFFLTLIWLKISNSDFSIIWRSLKIMNFPKIWSM